jgi:hypothetical protein
MTNETNLDGVAGRMLALLQGAIDRPVWKRQTELGEGWWVLADVAVGVETPEAAKAVVDLLGFHAMKDTEPRLQLEQVGMLLVDVAVADVLDLKTVSGDEWMPRKGPFLAPMIHATQTPMCAAFTEPMPPGVEVLFAVVPLSDEKVKEMAARIADLPDVFSLTPPVTVPPGDFSMPAPTDATGPRMTDRATADPVDHPPHYTNHPSGIEAIELCEPMSFCLGNAVKYVLRAPHKGNELEDLEKALWYLRRWLAAFKDEGADAEEWVLLPDDLAQRFLAHEAEGPRHVALSALLGAPDEGGVEGDRFVKAADVERAMVAIGGMVAELKAKLDHREPGMAARYTPEQIQALARRADRAIVISLGHHAHELRYCLVVSGNSTAPGAIESMALASFDTEEGKRIALDVVAAMPIGGPVPPPAGSS